MALSGDPSAPKFRAGAFIYGVFDFPAAIERSPNRTAIEGMARDYLGARYPGVLKDPRVSPLRAIKPGALPPCFAICGTADALLPESRSIAAALQQVGIPYDCTRSRRCLHAFKMIGALSAYGEGHRLMFNFLGRHV